MCEYQYEEIDVTDNIDDVPRILEVVGWTAICTDQLIFQVLFLLW